MVCRLSDALRRRAPDAAWQPGLRYDDQGAWHCLMEWQPSTSWQPGMHCWDLWRHDLALVCLQDENYDEYHGKSEGCAGNLTAKLALGLPILRLATFMPPVNLTQLYGHWPFHCIPKIMRLQRQWNGYRARQRSVKLNHHRKQKKSTMLNSQNRSRTQIGAACGYQDPSVSWFAPSRCL